MNLVYFKYLNLHFWSREFKWRRISKKLSKTKLLILDIDGVLTDGGLWFGENGEILKRFCVRDGLGLKMLQKNNILIAFMTGSNHLANQKRADQLGIDYCFIGIKDKYQKIKYISDKLNVPSQNITFVGDDLNDIPAKDLVGLFLAPSDANNSVIKKAHAVMRFKGGQGAVRELSERILESRKKLYNFKENGWRDRND